MTVTETGNVLIFLYGRHMANVLGLTDDLAQAVVAKPSSHQAGIQKAGAASCSLSMPCVCAPTSDRFIN